MSEPDSAPRSSGPHQNQPVYASGTPLDRAALAMIMVHGRGATPQGILTLSAEFDTPGVAYLAPQAAGYTWYPYRFLEPLADNEPWLSSALQAISDLLAQVSQAGIPAERTLLLGFSQGACLVLEYAARHATRYGGVIGLSGGLIGPDGTPRSYAGSLDGTPVFLGCSDRDFHIPKARVDLSAEILAQLGGDVTKRLYPNLDHTINADEIQAVRDLLGKLARPSSAG